MSPPALDMRPPLPPSAAPLSWEWTWPRGWSRSPRSCTRILSSAGATRRRSRFPTKCSTLWWGTSFFSTSAVRNGRSRSSSACSAPAAGSPSPSGIFPSEPGYSACSYAVAAARATPPAGIPLGPPFFRFSDDGEFVRLLTGQGLEEATVRTVSFMHSVPSPDDLWRDMLGGTVRTSALVLHHPDEMQRQIRTAFDRIVQQYTVDDHR